MVFIRWAEDAYMLGRFTYFYAKAPELRPRHVGFTDPNENMSMKDRAKFAWAQTMTQVQRRQ